MTENRDKTGESELVTVLATSDVATMVMAKSLLEASGIAYYAKGEQIQSLFGLGRIGGVNPICGAVELQVAAEDYGKSLEAFGDSFGKEVRDVDETEDDS